MDRRIADRDFLQGARAKLALWVEDATVHSHARVLEGVHRSVESSRVEEPVVLPPSFCPLSFTTTSPGWTMLSTLAAKDAWWRQWEGRFIIFSSQRGL